MPRGGQFSRAVGTRSPAPRRRCSTWSPVASPSAPSGERRSVFPAHRASVHVRRIEGRRGPVDEAWVVLDPEIESPQDGVVAEAFAGIPRRPDGTIYDGFVISERRTLVEWGASGGAWETIIEVGSHIPSEVVSAAVALAMDRIAAGLRIRPRPIDRETALRHASSALRATYEGLRSAELEPCAEEHDRESERWRFEFRHDRDHYGVVVASICKMPAVVHITRREDALRLRGTVKPSANAYVGSNPTPATSRKGP